MAPISAVERTRLQLSALLEATTAIGDAVVAYDHAALVAATSLADGLTTNVAASAAGLTEPELVELVDVARLIAQDLRRVRRHNETLIERAWQIEASQMQLLVAISVDATKTMADRPLASSRGARA